MVKFTVQMELIDHGKLQVIKYRLVSGKFETHAKLVVGR